MLFKNKKDWIRHLQGQEVKGAHRDVFFDDEDTFVFPEGVIPFDYEEAGRESYTSKIIKERGLDLLDESKQADEKSIPPKTDL